MSRQGGPKADEPIVLVFGSLGFVYDGNRIGMALLCVTPGSQSYGELANLTRKRMVDRYQKRFSKAARSSSG